MFFTDKHSFVCCLKIHRNFQTQRKHVLYKYFMHSIVNCRFLPVVVSLSHLKADMNRMHMKEKKNNVSQLNDKGQVADRR